MRTHTQDAVMSECAHTHMEMCMRLCERKICTDLRTQRFVELAVTVSGELTVYFERPVYEESAIFIQLSCC